MPTGETQNNTVDSTISFDYLVEPLRGEDLKSILPGLENGILFVAKISQFKDNINIVPKGTVLFNSDFSKVSYENIIVSEGKYVASCKGIFVLDKGKPKLIPTSKNACLDVSIEAKKMSASITLYPSLTGGRSLQVTDVLAHLQKKGIKCGVNKNAILSSLTKCEKLKQVVEDVLIASARLPEKGDNGKIECTANWQVDSKPSVNQNGTLNFHEIHSVVAVSKDQKVGTIIPPKKGRQGFDIFNNPIEPKPGKDADVSLSTNVYISDKDNTTILSKIDGFLEFKNDIIHIKDQHVVSGDIDFHTGNISGNGSLKISGSVLNGFKLNLRDEIEIDGNIGDAFVKSGKDITVKGGFSGSEHGTLIAGGDISIKYIENQSVYSNGSLTFRKDILHSKVHVSKSIKGNGGNTCIIGGYTIAGEGIEVAQLGNDSGTTTIIELGYDFSLKEKIDANRQKIDEIFEIVKQIDQQLINFSAMKRLNPEQVKILKSIAEQRKTYLADVDELKQTNEQLKTETLETSDAHLKCSRKIFPGVIITINGRTLNIKESMHSKTFHLSKQGEITF